MFPDDFKQTLINGLHEAINDLFEEHPDIKQRLNIPLNLYSVEEEIRKLPSFNNFVNTNRALIKNKYHKLIRPRLQIINDGVTDIEASILNHFIEDYFHYSIYKCLEADDVNKEFEKTWQFFQSEFFSDENKFEFRARLKSVYYHGGIGLENIIPWKDVELVGANSALDYRILGWERRGGHLYEFMDHFQPTWLVLKKKVTISANNNLLTVAKEAENQFNLFAFVVRNVSEGGAYFNDIRFFGLGHLSPHSDFGASWFPVKDNDIYEEFEEYTTIEHPWDWDISKVLAKSNPTSYRDYVFADWHIKLNGKFNLPFDQEYSKTRKQYFFYEKILNLSFVFNSLLPDLMDKNGYPSSKKNKTFREDYLPEILNQYGGVDKTMAKTTIKTIYDIRNNIAHGKSVDAASALWSIGTEEDINNKIHFFSYLVSKLILLSLVNNSLKNEMENYYSSGNPQSLPALVNPFS